MRIVVEQRPRAAPDGNMARVAVVFPAYDEERHVEEAVATALSVGVGRVICVNDCSRDATGRIIDRLARDGRVEAVHHEVNQGKQAAVKHGLQAAVRQGGLEAVAVLDADMQNDPRLLPGLCPHVGAYDLVVGRRDTGEMPAIRRLANDLANAPYQLMAAARTHDVQSGYRVYGRQAAAYLAENLSAGGRYTLEHTSLVLCGRLAAERGRDLRIAEVRIPCAYGEAQSTIRAKDNVQLTWAAVYNAAALARIRRQGGALAKA